MEHDSTLYVGLDVHRDSITVAYALDMGQVELLGKIGCAVRTQFGMSHAWDYERIAIRSAIVPGLYGILCAGHNMSTRSM